MKTEGVVTEGKNVPAVKKPYPAEHEHGVAMGPGWAHEGKVKMTGRTHNKHKSFEREPLPSTPKA